VSDPFLQELRERFRETSLERLAEMRALLDSQPDADAVHTLARHFHAFAGLGTTYGFREVSELGDEGEESILPLVRNGESPSAQTLARWRELSARIENALASGEAIEVPTAPAAERRRILAIDDDATHGVFLEHVLESAGYEVKICEDAVSCEATLVTFPPDVLLVDIHLGDSDRGGYELVERLRAQERFRTIPVIFVSADREVEPGSTDPHIVKPVDWTALLALIGSVLQGPPPCGPQDASSKSSPTPTADD
jgi:CheY-like chemotaxis protein